MNPASASRRLRPRTPCRGVLASERADCDTVVLSLAPWVTRLTGWIIGTSRLGCEPAAWLGVRRWWLARSPSSRPPCADAQLQPALRPSFTLTATPSPERGFEGH